MQYPEGARKLLDAWQNDPLKMKPVFTSLMEDLAGRPGVSLDFKARPGISYSLRARHEAQKKRELFVLIDVIDDEPENRWLSVCFYADMVRDPEESGDFVPQGLMGEDARCFNLDDADPAGVSYVAERVAEAFRNAAGA